MKRKAIDIMDYNYRSDYKQVLYLKESDCSVINRCIVANFKDLFHHQCSLLSD